ncbi:hypothetical protein, partial [Pseudoalteromonas sp. GABNS16H]|uniref:hypothetical protein n=1 Tax=Pseudoalteromonas sp. GABNS16H TaxID=3025325 RepID=UPI0023603C2C
MCAAEVIHAHDVKDGHVEPPYQISFIQSKISCPHCLEVKGLAKTNKKTGLEMSHQSSQTLKLGNDPDECKLTAIKDKDGVFLIQKDCSWAKKD